MIKTRLISLVPDSKKYIFCNVLLQWLGMLSNVWMILVISQIFEKLKGGEDVAFLTSIGIIISTIIIRGFSLKFSQTMSFYALANPGSFETKVQDPTEEYPFIYHNLVCPLSNFAKNYGYEKYMPYICNLDYAMFGSLGVPLYRTHTCFSDGDYCDFSLKPSADVMNAWPPIFTQNKGFK